jgi:hypothetical protein
MLSSPSNEKQMTRHKVLPHEQIPDVGARRPNIHQAPSAASHAATTGRVHASIEKDAKCL